MIMKENRTELYKISNLNKDFPNYDRIIKLHKESIEKDIDFYIDPKTRLNVMTSKYLLKRGYCCENGCRHCPYKK